MADTSDWPRVLANDVLEVVSRNDNARSDRTRGRVRLFHCGRAGAWVHDPHTEGCCRHDDILGEHAWLPDGVAGGLRIDVADGTITAVTPGAPRRSELPITDIGALTTNDDELGTLTDAALVFDGVTVAWMGPAAATPNAERLRGRPARGVRGAGCRSAVRGGRDRGDRGGDLAAEPARARRRGPAPGHDLPGVQDRRRIAVADQLRADRGRGGRRGHLPRRPPGADQQSYVDLVCDEVLDAVAGYVRWANVFCDTGAFDGARAEHVLRRGSTRPWPAGARQPAGPRAWSGARGARRRGLRWSLFVVVRRRHPHGARRGGDPAARVRPVQPASARARAAAARRRCDGHAGHQRHPGSCCTRSMPYRVTAVLQMGLSVEEEVVRAATLGGARRVPTGCTTHRAGLATAFQVA